MFRTRSRPSPRCYAICAAARSGSHLLGDGLRATRLAGRPEQYFNPELEKRFGDKYGLDPAQDYAGYVRGVIAAAATSNGVFGFRLMAWDLDGFVTRLRLTNEFGAPNAADADLLRSALPGLRFIHLARSDRLRQAISKARAMQTGLWKIGPNKVAAAEAKFDPDLIAHCLESARVEEQTWSEFFVRNKVEPLRITYEELCRQYEETIKGVLEFLEIRLPRGQKIGPPVTVRQSDALSADWAERYRSLTHQAV